MFELTDIRRDVLAALCDTVVPAIARVPDPDGFFGRKASDLWVPQVIEYALPDMPEEQSTSLMALLDTLAGEDFLGCSPRSRERIVEADVCVVGSGAGGSVIAGALSDQGLSVVVLEAGGYFDDGDFTQLEIPAYQKPLLARRSDPDRRFECRATGRRLPGGRDSRQLGPTRCAPPSACGRSGKGSSAWRAWPAVTSSRTWTPCGSD